MIFFWIIPQQMITEDLTQDPRAMNSPAEIHISLCYYPSAERFSVTILQAKNIKVQLSSNLTRIQND